MLSTLVPSVRYVNRLLRETKIKSSYLLDNCFSLFRSSTDRVQCSKRRCGTLSCCPANSALALSSMHKRLLLLLSEGRNSWGLACRSSWPPPYMQEAQHGVTLNYKTGCWFSSFSPAFTPLRTFSVVHLFVFDVTEIQVTVRGALCTVTVGLVLIALEISNVKGFIKYSAVIAHYRHQLRIQVNNNEDFHFFLKKSY